jgi:hypothetical protein
MARKSQRRRSTRLKEQPTAAFCSKIALQEFAGYGGNVERPEIGDEVFSGPVAGRGSGGQESCRAIGLKSSG